MRSADRRMPGFLVLAPALALVAIAAPLLAQTGGVTGACKSDKGELLVGYEILIERQGVKGIYKTKTNKKGEYIYIGLPLGDYKISLLDPSGKLIYHFDNKHLGIGDPAEVNFDMAKERTEQVKAHPEIEKQQQEQAKLEKETANLRALFDQGVSLDNDKKYAEAAGVFEQAIPLAKGNNLVIVYGKVAESYRNARAFDKAVEYYNKAIEVSPQDATLRNQLGSALADSGKIPEAQAQFQKAVELDPAGASRAYFNMGVVMYNKGKMNEAAEAFKKATEVDANYADAYFLEAQALASKLDMTADGKVVAPAGYVEALQTYLKLEPSGKHAAEAQGALQMVSGKIQTEFKSEKKKKKP